MSHADERLYPAVCCASFHRPPFNNEFSLLCYLQVYVCAAFLGTWQRDVPGLEFQELMMFLQKLPTAGWGEPNMEVILSNAYVLRNTWGNAQSHMQS